MTHIKQTHTNLLKQHIKQKQTKRIPDSQSLTAQQTQDSHKTTTTTTRKHIKRNTDNNNDTKHNNIM